MKITLIYPGVTECGFNSIKGNEGSWINHGLAVLSSVLKNKKHQVNLIDLRRLMNWEHYSRVIEDELGEVAGITMMSVDYDCGIRAAEIIKKVKPDTKIFVGGPHPSICPQQLEAERCIDCVVKGEAEITFPALIDDLADGKELPKVVQGRRLENLDDAPWPDRDLFSCPEEPFVNFLKPPFVTLIAARGCKYNCNFCQPAERIIFGRTVRRRSAANAIEELEYLRDKYNFNSFMLHDDCLTDDRRWVLQFCELYKSKGFKQPFVVQSRADIICRNRDMIEALRDSGLELIIIGFESGSDRVLKFLRKGCTRQQNIEAADICKHLGIKIWANYMLGLPTETKEEVLETLSMLKKIKPYHCSPAFYTPHPGSDLFEMGEKMGIHLTTNRNLYRRSTYKPKIKGPNYRFLTNILYKTIALAEDQNQPSLSSGDSNVRQDFMLILKNKFKIAMMTRAPGLFHILRSLKKKVEISE
jgi:anaerobic magnesium-protoporphyrin IX monomethyl ester cyclase